jgi:hypothetical protein
MAVAAASPAGQWRRAIASLTIAIGEIAAAEHRDAHRAEIAGRCNAQLRGRLTSVFDGVVLGNHICRTNPGRHRQPADATGRVDGRQGGQPMQNGHFRADQFISVGILRRGE